MNNNPITLFRDAEAHEGKGYFDSDKINAQLKTLNDVQDEAYNKGIGHAIELIRQWYIDKHDSNFYHYFHDELKPMLEAMKTNTTKEDKI